MSRRADGSDGPKPPAGAHRDRAYAPRGLRREAAAYWVGLSPTKFDEAVAAGVYHPGKMVLGCRVWDRYQLDIEFENALDDRAAPGLAPNTAADAWSGVK
ncbi:hypothetical protein ACE10Z_23365 [Bradyrhizobium sp. Pha-3]|uniref:hypothetical protein n=1 Tax=Bradyrhizobium sp. Pha-3 TaxID=208375 RepID=UPI0035D4F761